MSLLFVAPELLASATADLKSIGAELDAAHAAVAVPTTGLVAAGADEVSAAVTALFSEYGQAFHALSAQASTFHTQFVQALSGTQGAYAAAEAQRVSRLRRRYGVAARCSRLPVLTGRRGSFSNFASSNGAVGILGVGASTVGPNTTSPTTALQGNLGQGVLINEPQHQLVFGPNTGNVLATTATGGGSTANLTYTVGATTLYQPHDRRFGWCGRNPAAIGGPGRQFRA